MEQLGQEDPKSGQRLLVAMVVMMALLAVWSWFYKPAAPPAGTPAAQGVAATATPAMTPAEETPKGEAPKGQAEAVAQAVAGEAESSVELSNADLALTFSSRGGVLTKAILKHYAYAGQPDDLVSPLSTQADKYPLAVVTGDEAYDREVAAALFHVEQTSGQGGAKSVTFDWSDGKGNAVHKALTLDAKGYLLDLTVSAVKDGKALSPVPLAWGPGFAGLEKSQAENRYFLQEYVGLEEGGSFKKVTRSKVKADNPMVTDTYGTKGPLGWAAITNNYFAAAFWPDSPMPWVRVVTEHLSEDAQKIHPADSDITLVVGFPGKGRLFLGPKAWDILKEMGGNFTRLTNWGWLGPLCAVLLWGLKWLYSGVGNYGVAILLLTLIIKVAFFPLTQRSMVKMKEMGDSMKRLKPQVDRIKSKYKKIGRDMATRQKMNEEMMALYQREGVNPLGGMSGCLPLLIQMPIFFALFDLLPKAIELRGAPFFGWIQDLSVKDPYYVTPILMGVTMAASTLMTSTQTLEGAQKAMMWLMPVMFTWFCLWAPAGLTLYWLANNVLTIGQQTLINRQAAAKQAEIQKSRKSTPKGPSRPSHA